ncbi:MAG TPA: hypothetical protein VH879_12845 [Gemmatimonadales bacterium]|jgi:hypothetical protein
MTASMRQGKLVIPELGPPLGKLVAPPPPPPGTPSHWILLDDIRIALVTQLFDLAGDARRWAEEGDRELALATLNRKAWEEAWRRAVDAVAKRAADAVSERLLAAAREARVPARRARRLPLDPPEVQALAARLDGGGSLLGDALAVLDQAAHQARSDHATREAVAAWHHGLLTAARRLEAAWLQLEESLGREWNTWADEVEAVRSWRRPVWPLLAIAAVLLLLGGYIGLVLGGYLPVPAPLRGIAEAIWTRWS